MTLSFKIVVIAEHSDGAVTTANITARSATENTTAQDVLLLFIEELRKKGLRINASVDEIGEGTP